MLSPELRNKRKRSRIITSIQHCREVITCAIREENKMNSIKQSSKFSLFADTMMVCKENLKESEDNTSNKNKNELF